MTQWDILVSLRRSSTPPLNLNISESKEDDSLGIGNHHQSSLSWFTLGLYLLPGSSVAGNQFGDAHLDGSLEAIVFHIEVPGAVGLPKPEVTYVQIAGLGLEEVVGRVGWFHKREEAHSSFFFFGRVCDCVCVTFFLQLLCQHMSTCYNVTISLLLVKVFGTVFGSICI